MDFMDLLRNRRAVREFEDKAVDNALLQAIIKETCLAPSAGNGQPWRFVVIHDRDLIKRISDESKANLLALLEENPESPVRIYAGALRNRDFNVFYNAPCLVFIVGSKRVRSLTVDCALAASYFMFSAVDKGLGTTWVDLGSHIKSPDLLAEMGLTDQDKIVAPLIIGYPKALPGVPERRPPEILKIIV
jgi:nitroreductase